MVRPYENHRPAVRIGCTPGRARLHEHDRSQRGHRPRVGHVYVDRGPRWDGRRVAPAGRSDGPAVFRRTQPLQRQAHPGHSANGNAGAVLLRPARNDRERQGPISTGRHHGVVSPGRDHAGQHSGAVRLRKRNRVASREGLARRRGRLPGRTRRQPLLRGPSNGRRTAPVRLEQGKVPVLQRRRPLRAADRGDGGRRWQGGGEESRRRTHRRRHPVRQPPGTDGL